MLRMARRLADPVLLDHVVDGMHGTQQSSLTELAMAEGSKGHFGGFHQGFTVGYGYLWDQ